MIKAAIDTLSQHPQLGMGGSFGGFLASIFASTPLFQFLSALFGATIGLITLIGILKRKYYERAHNKSDSNT